MRVAVVVVAHNSADDLPALLASVPQSLAGHEITVVVVDSGSTDDSLAVARAARPDVVTADLGGNRGYAAGVNAGWAAVEGHDVMVLLNPDLTVDPDAFGPWLAAVDADGGIVAPRIRNLDGELEPSLRRTPTAWRALVESVIGGRLAGRFGLGELINEPGSYNEPTAAPWVSGAAMAITAECLAAVGPWEERFFLYSEETDFCLRATAAGHRVRLEPAAGVVHRGGEFWVSSPLYSLLTWNRVRLHRRHHGRVGGLMMQLAVSVGEAIRGVRGEHAHVHRDALSSLWSAPRRASTVPPESHLEWKGAV